MKEEQFFKDAGTPEVFLQFKGIWDMQDIYETVADFMRENKFKFYEKFQRHRSPSPFGVERQHVLSGEREVEHYYKWTVNATLETFDEHDVEVVTKDGQKKTLTKGRLWVRIVGNVEMDFEGIYEKSAFTARLRNFYHNHVVKKKIEGVWWDQLYYHIVLKLHAKLKERLKMVSEGYEHRHFSGVH